MPATPLSNYLRTCRKKAALSQEEASRLVGLKNRVQFARYERHQSEPPLGVVLACEQICGVPTAELFAGESTAVAKRTRQRVRAFERRLPRASTGAASRRFQFKLQWTAHCVARLKRYMYGK
jgi:transcriptional regulator with XRE-family HTH domain